MGGLVVDLAARTITGVAVPYGTVARSGGRRFRFTPGWARHDQVLLLRDHNHSLRLGRATALVDARHGLVAAFLVRRTPRGDRALHAARHGELGLSVGPEWQPGDLQPDPEHAGVLLVVGGDLPEISLTARPAFDTVRG